MSTQNSDNHSVALSIRHPFTNIRLLELPNELLDIVSDSSAQRPSIRLVSSPAVDVDADTSNKEGFLHLCTNDRVWSVKQVSTSNSLYVCQTQENSTSENDTDLDGVPNSAVGITAFAKPTSMLELHSVQTSTYETVIQSTIQRLIPTWKASTQKPVSLDNNTAIASSDIYDHVPAPADAIDKMTARMCVFDIVIDNATAAPIYQAYQPSPELLLETWRFVNEAVTTSTTKGNTDDGEAICTAFNRYAAELNHNDIEKYHLAVAERMLLDSSQASGHPKRLSMFSALNLTLEGQRNVLNAIEVARWVGNLYLNVIRGRGTDWLHVDAFIKEWEDLVPAQWVKYCSVEVLENACEVGVLSGESDEQGIRWKPFVLSTNNSMTLDATSDAGRVSKSSTASSTKRKWHEKFASQRNMKKQ